MFDFLKVGNTNKVPVRNYAVSDSNVSNPIPVNNPVSYPQNNLPDNVAYRVLPNQNAVIDTSKIKIYSKMYSELSNFVDDEGKKALQTLHQNKKLYSNASNDGSATVENLYKLMKEPRAAGFDSKIVLTETLKTLANPDIITQDFGKFTNVPDSTISSLVNDENAKIQHKLEEEKKHPHLQYEKKEILKTLTPMEVLKGKAVELAKNLGVQVSPDEKLEKILDLISQTNMAIYEKVAKDPQKAAQAKQIMTQIVQYQQECQTLSQAAEDFDFNKGHTCPAASMEFDLASRKPAEFSRYVERLTSPDKSVKTRIKYSNIADDLPAAISKLVDWKVDYKKLNADNIEVTLRPDENAYPRSIIQEYARAKDSRSVIDTLIQSTFMQTGSEKTYNSLTDLRSEDTGNGRGLNQEEGAFTESIVDYEGGKDSVTFMDLDENLTKLNKYNFDPQTTKNMLIETLNSGKNIMVGFLTTLDKNGSLATPDGHEILLTGVVQDKNGVMQFKYNDTDDGDHYAPSYINADELIRTLHHANLPREIVKKYVPAQKDPRLLLIQDYWMLKQQNSAAPAASAVKSIG